MLRLFAFLGAFAMGCAPNLGQPESLVTSTRVLAVRGTPPEARAGTSIQYDLLVVSPQGSVASPEAMWSYCLASRPPGDNNVVSNDCLSDSSQSAMSGPAPASSIALPMNSCQLFGPDVPSVENGKPPQAPAVPDSTNGYYQPLRVELPDSAVDGNPAIGLERVMCGLANASSDNAIQYNSNYHANLNPMLADVSAGPMIVHSAESSASPLTVAASSKVEFTADWPASAAETFPDYDVSSFTLGHQRESIVVSWFATDGAFASDRTGRASDDFATSTGNDWTAPATTGVVHFWVVIRDSRGGVDFGSFDVTVR